MLDMSWVKWQEIHEDKDAEIKDNDSEIVKTGKSLIKSVLDANKSSYYKQGWVEGVDAMVEALDRKDEENERDSE